MILTFKFRIKDKRAAKMLRQHAWATNQVWNYLCEIQRKAESRWKAGANNRWPTMFDLINLCAGSSQMLGIHSDTISEVCRHFVAARKAAKHCPKFRASGGAKRALGWVPHRGLKTVNVSGDTVTYLKRKYRLWLSRAIDGGIKTGAFVEDARGRWYATFQCEEIETRAPGNGQVGIDLGLKTLATCSDGTTVPALRHYRQYEAALATASRARDKRRVRAIHAKIANVRHHHLHQWSTKIARENALIVVGNVSPAALAKGRMAKSILDASWGVLRAQLKYKASRHQARYVEVDERFTSQACSCCGVIPDSSPKGIDALGVRAWTCSDCGAPHDRDVNAARNILRLGLERQPPVVEIAA
jgi:putative transposase